MASSIILGAAMGASILAGLSGISSFQTQKEADGQMDAQAAEMAALPVSTSTNQPMMFTAAMGKAAGGGGVGNVPFSLTGTASATGTGATVTTNSAGGQPATTAPATTSNSGGGGQPGSASGGGHRQGAATTNSGGSQPATTAPTATTNGGSQPGAGGGGHRHPAP